MKFPSTEVLTKGLQRAEAISASATKRFGESSSPTDRHIVGLAESAVARLTRALERVSGGNSGHVL